MVVEFFRDWNIWSIITRIIIAGLLGAVVGIDRGVTRRGGGSKTTMTVCLAATLITLTDLYVHFTFPGTADLTRMSAQVVSGVGFLGAGSIMVSGTKIKGLSSAASIWACACIGIATGLGFIFGAIAITLLLLFGLHVLPYIEDAFYKHTNYLPLYIEVENGKAITEFLHKIKNDGCKVDTYEVEKPKAKGQYFIIMAVIQTPRKMNNDDYMEELRELKGIVSVDEM